MNYLETLRPEAEQKIRPLAETVATLERNVAALQKRLTIERAKAAAAQSSLEAMKSNVGATLAAGRDYARFKSRMSRHQQDLAAAKEALHIFDAELIPNEEAKLQAARVAADRAMEAFYREHVPQCEALMVELLNQVVAERDAFLGAMLQIGRDLAVAVCGELPRARHARLEGVRREAFSDPLWLIFTPAPKPPATAATPPTTPPDAAAVTVQPSPTPPDAPATAAPIVPDGESVKPAEAPQAATVTPQPRYVLTDDVTAPEPLEDMPDAAACPVADTLDGLDLEAQDGDDLDAEPDAEAPPAVAAEDLPEKSS